MNEEILNSKKKMLELEKSILEIISKSECSIEEINKVLLKLAVDFNNILYENAIK